MTDLDPETAKTVAEAMEKALTPERTAEMAENAAALTWKLTEFAETVYRLKVSAERKLAVTLEPYEAESIIWGIQILRKGPDTEE